MSNKLTALSCVAMLALGSACGFFFADAGDDFSGQSTMNYSGRITAPDGTALDGDQALRFSIWDTASSDASAAKNMGSALWHEMKLVQAKNGAYAVNFSSLPSSVYNPTDPAKTQRYMQVEVCNQNLPSNCDVNNNAHWDAIDADSADADTDRLLLGSSLFAMNASLLDGAAPNDFLMFNDVPNTNAEVTGKLTTTEAKISGHEMPSAAAAAGRMPILDDKGNIIWGSGYGIENTNAQYDITCTALQEGLMRYNPALKSVEYCTKDLKWKMLISAKKAGISSNTFTPANLTVGNVEDITLEVVFGADTNPATINLSGITFSNDGGSCSVSAVNAGGNALTKEIVITGCDVSVANAITVNIPSNSAYSITGNPMRGQTFTFNVI